MAKDGRTTVYNNLTSDDKLKLVNPDNLELQKDFTEYLIATDKAETTITQYTATLNVLWCWSLDYNNNTAFTDFTKRQITRFQNQALNEWGWSSRRMRFAKSVARSLENYIVNMLDDDYPDYKKIWDKIESPISEPVREKTVMKDEDFDKLFDYLLNKKKYMQACWLALAVYSGRRKSETVRFKVSYFTEDNLICEGALYKTPEKIKTKGRGKHGKMLYAYTLANPFKPYFDLWMEERKKLGVESDWLFPHKVGGQWLDEPIPTSTIDSWCRTFSKVIGNQYAHAYRHRFTTALAEQGIPDNVIKDIVGWSDLNLVALYNDMEAEDTFDRYFGADGIKQVEQKGLSDL